MSFAMMIQAVREMNQAGESAEIDALSVGIAASILASYDGLESAQADTVALTIGQDVDGMPENFGEDLADVVPDGFGAAWPGDETAEPLSVPADESEAADGFKAEFPMSGGSVVVNGSEAAEAEAEKPVQRASFTASRKELQAALTIASSATPRRSPRAILQAVKMSINGTVEFSATDCEQSARITCDFEREGEAEILVYPARLLQALKTSKAPTVDVTILGESLIVGPSTIPAADDVAEFPGAGWKFEPSEIVASFFVDGQRFAECVKRTEFATDEESTRYALGGIQLEADGEAVTLAATDSRRLSVAEMGKPEEFLNVAKPGERFSVVVPLATMNRVAKAVGKSARTIQVVAHESAPVWCAKPIPGIDAHGKPTEEKHVPDSPAAALQLTFIVHTADGSQTFTTKPVDGRFPDYRKIIPANCHAEHVFNAGDLLQVCKLAQTVATEEQRGVDFDFYSDTCKISASTECGKMSDYVRCSTVYNMADGPIKASFDPRYLVDLLSALPKDTAVSWRLIDHESAAVLLADDRLTYVVMPLSRDA